MSDIKQIAWIARDVTCHLYENTQMQLCHNNSFSTIMQLPYDTNHNGMLMSFSSIHLDLTSGIMKIFLVNF